MEVPSWHILLVQCLTFVIGALLLWVIAVKPIRRILDERRNRIVATQDEAAAAKERADDRERELNVRLARIEGEAKTQARKAEVAARKLKDEMLADARKEAKAFVASAREEAKREREELRDRLRGEVARLAVSMARKVTGMAMTAKDRRRLVRKVLDQIPGKFGGTA